MGFQLSIRGMLIGLFIVTVGGTLFLAMTGLFTNARVVSAQSLILDEVLPQQEAARNMAGVVQRFGERHSALLAADSSAVLERVPSEAELEQAFNSAVSFLNIHTDDTQTNQLLSRLEADFHRYMEADARLLSQRERQWGLLETLGDRTGEADGLIRRVLVDAESMAGQATLEQIRQRRSVQQALGRVDGDLALLRPAMVMSLVEQRLDIARVSGEVQTVVALIAELGRRMQLVDDPDLLVSLRYNEIAQEVNRARQALTSIQRSADASPEQRRIAQDLEARVSELNGVLVTNDDAIYALRQQQLQLALSDQEAMAEMAGISLAVHGALADMEAFIDNTAAGAIADSAQAATAGRVLLIGATVGVIAVVGIFGLRTMRRVLKPIAQIRSQMESISGTAGTSSDLSVRIHTGRHDEIGQTADAFNAMMNTFQRMIEGIVSSARDLGAASERLGELSRSSHALSDQQRNETQDVAAAINEMTVTVQEVARNTQHAVDLANNGAQAATKGQAVVTESSRAIEAVSSAISRAETVITSLKSRSDSVSKVLLVIQDVSDQTNLLALNAAIEAARAGEHGRGFAVVADEVRTLAQRTKESALEIEELISGLQDGVNEGVSAMRESRDQADATMGHASEAGGALEVITITVTEINDMNTQIATAAEEQSAVAEQINESISRLSRMATESADSNAHLTSASDEMTRVSGELRSMASRFRT